MALARVDLELVEHGPSELGRGQHPEDLVFGVDHEPLAAALVHLGYVGRHRAPECGAAAPELQTHIVRERAGRVKAYPLRVLGVGGGVGGRRPAVTWRRWPRSG